MYKLLISDKLSANEPIDPKIKSRYETTIIDSYASLLLPQEGKSKSYSLAGEISCDITITVSSFSVCDP